jgi:hypothetical protein
VFLAHGNPSPEQTFLEIGQAHYNGFGLSRQGQKLRQAGKEKFVLSPASIWQWKEID